MYMQGPSDELFGTKIVYIYLENEGNSTNAFNRESCLYHMCVCVCVCVCVNNIRTRTALGRWN